VLIDSWCDVSCAKYNHLTKTCASNDNLALAEGQDSMYSRTQIERDNDERDNDNVLNARELGISPFQT
jgi:hypothetical protein